MPAIAYDESYERRPAKRKKKAERIRFNYVVYIDETVQLSLIVCQLASTVNACVNSKYKHK